MRVAEHAGREQIRVRAHLRLGVKAAAGVVEIDVPIPVETAIFSGAQSIDRGGCRVLRMMLDELLQHSLQGHRLYSTPRLTAGTR